jgi:alcohol dehydrogenase
MMQEFYGNCIGILRKILEKHKPKKVFLVTGKKSFETSGAKAIEELEFEFVRFSEFDVNPKVEDVKRGVEVFEKEECDLVVAVGGGSALDIAKVINLFAANEVRGDGCIEAIKENKEMEKGSTFVAIPTTSGTGSEATKFAVVYIDKTKYSVAHENIIPDYAIMDVDLTMSLPQHQTACTGMDAFCQAVESYWAVNSTDESKKYARKAIEIILKNLERAVNNPNRDNREAMMKAANLAGKAINISRTTACHAISYPITTYFNVPHGHAVALTLGKMLVYNNGAGDEDCVDVRGADFVREAIKEIVDIFGAKDIEEGVRVINELMKNIGLTIKLSDVGVKDVEVIVENGFNPDRMGNNPRRLTAENLRNLLKEIL